MKPKNQKTVRFAVYVSPELYQALLVLSERTGVPLSTLSRKAVVEKHFGQLSKIRKELNLCREEWNLG